MDSTVNHHEMSVIFFKGGHHPEVDAKKRGLSNCAKTDWTILLIYWYYIHIHGTCIRCNKFYHCISYLYRFDTLNHPAVISHQHTILDPHGPCIPSDCASTWWLQCAVVMERVFSSDNTQAGKPLIIWTNLLEPLTSRSFGSSAKRTTWIFRYNMI